MEKDQPKLTLIDGGKKPKYEPLLDGKGQPIENLFRHTKSGLISVRKKFGSLGIPPLFCSTGEMTVGKAKSKAELLELEHKAKHLGLDTSSVLSQRKTGKLFGEVADEVLREYTPTQRAGTRANHHIYIGELKEQWKHVYINDITERFYLAWLKGFREYKRKQAIAKERPPRQTFLDYAKNANVVMTYAYKNRYTTHHITFRDPDTVARNALANRIKEKKRGGFRLLPEEKDALELKSCRLLKSTQLTKLWSVMNEDLRDEFVLSFECMMRLREGLHLEWDRVNLETGVITLNPEDVKTGSKTGRGRSFRMRQRAWDRMKARYERRSPNNPYVFPGWSKKDPHAVKPVNSNKTAWKKAKALAGIAGKCRWHDLRHTALTFALLGDPDAKAADRAKMIKDPLQVSEYAGVSMRTIQAVYLHAKDEHTKSVAEGPSALDGLSNSPAVHPLSTPKFSKKGLKRQKGAKTCKDEQGSKNA